jgi:hypothetical protein
VSPACDAVPAAFGATLDVLHESAVSCFKIGAEVFGLLRPDKLVAYFPSADDLHRAADGLRARLAGCAAHGVPFTASLTEDGLLSWGMDPPRDRRSPGLEQLESWRLWVTNRLATALVSARAARQSSIEPWQFALERVSLDGIDPTTWTPVSSIWSSAGGEP